ncbi:MAG: mechanosensitive ion channel family protein [Persicimonas sp.]
MEPDNGETSELAQVLMSGADQTPALFEPGWAIVMVLGAILASVVIGKLARLPGLRGVRRWLVLARVLLWTVVLFEVIFTLSWAITDYWLVLAVLLVGVLLVAGLDWLRDVAAGLALAFERTLQVGDRVRYGKLEGEIAAFGARAITLRSPDGTRHQIPNASFTNRSVTDLRVEGEAACDITVRVPEGLSPERAVELIGQVAFLTPLASPRRQPEVYWETGPRADGPVRIRIRGYAFDPAHRERFKSEVLSRIHERLASEAGVEPTSTAGG